MLTITSRPTENNSSAASIMNTAVDYEIEYTRCPEKDIKMFFSLYFL